jgi:uncharacterized protein YjbJ (UPF0337 family)
MEGPGVLIGATPAPQPVSGAASTCQRRPILDPVSAHRRAEAPSAPVPGELNVDTGGVAENAFKGFQGVIMNKDQIQGRVEEAKGSIKESAGRVTGRPDMEDNGTVQKAAGKIQKTYGDVKEQVSDATKDR